MSTWRIYYNRRDELPWSIDNGDQSTEINVSSVRCHRISLDSGFDQSIKPNRDVPCAWLTAQHAILEVKDGVANLFHDSQWRSPKLITQQEPERGDLP